MGKERLEEIEERTFSDLPFKIKQDDLRFVFQFAKEQAERVKELELECAGWKEAVRFEDEKLAKQNKRYREAINFAIDYLKNSDIRQVKLVVTGLKNALEEEEK